MGWNETLRNYNCNLTKLSDKGKKTLSDCKACCNENRKECLPGPGPRCGSGGGFNVVNFLTAFGHQLSDGKSAYLSISTKWDGAPAIICGRDPVNHRFFVGTKSVFNKVNPKVCYDDTDIDRYYQAEILRNKLKTFLK